MSPNAPLSRIVVPLDGSRRSEGAISPAVQLARIAGIPVTLFALTYDEAERGVVLRGLADLIPTLGDDLHIDVDIEAVGALTRLDEYVADAIVQQSSIGGTLVCMASHGRGGAGATLLGSVTEHVLRRSSVPILVTGPRVRQAANGDRNVIAVCVDGSTFSELALAPATALSARLGMPLWLIQVTDPDDSYDHERPSKVNEFGYLHSLALAHPKIENYDVLHDPHPSRAIAELPERQPIGMLVVATHGRSGWSRVKLGSVSMSVVHRGPCPVLVVPPALTARADIG